MIGSGATAIALVPAMAKEAAKVTMLQRSPSYVVSRPGEDDSANWLRPFYLKNWSNFSFAGAISYFNCIS
ncbi:hypothetical protein PsB1_1899 [Candidatus Phycosocius spiralis]|uniref:Uncharacterized protein n=1 Tax=Candidatus Phycosocius spiralis TaxID=2815099 RepID=A0ABQ4PXW3_9PROT|nr:hypothetical protein PsB1_1899 [Candidatus Phycosocius spiralis]